MAKGKSKSAKPSAKPKKAARKAAAPTKDEAVDVAVGSLLGGDNMPKMRDLTYHYGQILGYMEKARTAAGKVGEAKKLAKEAGIDVGALMNAMKMTRMEPLDLAAMLKQQAALMTDLGLPVQMQLFEPKYGSIEQQADAEGWAAGKAGRTPDMSRWPEGTPGSANYMSAWNNAQRDNVLNGTKGDDAEED